VHPELVQRTTWWVNHWLPILSAFAALVIVYLWARSLAPAIVIVSLLIAAAGKVGLDSARRDEEAEVLLVDAGSPGAPREKLDQVRSRVLVYSIVCNSSASTCVVAALLTVMYWYR
jgi:hypothetical protein